MFPTLSVGMSVSVLLRGRRHELPALVLAISDEGALSLALPPRTTGGRWRPLLVERQVVRGVWS